MTTASFVERAPSERAKNGLQTYVEESAALPFVSIAVAIRSGASTDPVGKEGLTRVMVRMLRRGCRGFLSHEIEEKIDALGAEFSADVRGETMAAIFLETASGAPVEVTGTMAAPGYPSRPPDRLEIVGVKTFIDGNNAFIARSLKKDGKTLTLRDADGKPAWKAATEGVDGCGVAHAPLPRGTEL